MTGSISAHHNKMDLRPVLHLLLPSKAPMIFGHMISLRIFETITVLYCIFERAAGAIGVDAIICQGPEILEFQIRKLRKRFPSQWPLYG